MGLSLLRFTLLSVSLIGMFRTAKVLGARLSILMLMSPLVIHVLFAREAPRPMLFTMAGLSVELWIIISVHRGHRSSRWLWVLPLMHLLWVNLHGAHIQGLVMLVVIVAAQAAMWARTRHLGSADTSHLPPGGMALVLLVCVLTSCVSPYGPRLLVFPFRMEDAWIRSTGGEWQSPHRTLEWSYLGWAIALYWGVLGLVLLDGVRRWRTCDLVPLAVVALWLVLSTRHLRTIMDAALMTAPFAVAAASHWRDRREARARDAPDPSTPAPGLIGVGLLCLLVYVGYVATWASPKRGWGFRAGFGWSRYEPLWHSPLRSGSACRGGYLMIMRANGCCTAFGRRCASRATGILCRARALCGTPGGQTWRRCGAADVFRALPCRFSLAGPRLSWGCRRAPTAGLGPHPPGRPLFCDGATAAGHGRPHSA